MNSQKLAWKNLFPAGFSLLESLCTGIGYSAYCKLLSMGKLVKWAHDPDHEERIDATAMLLFQYQYMVTSSTFPIRILPTMNGTVSPIMKKGLTQRQRLCHPSPTHPHDISYEQQCFLRMVHIMEVSAFFLPFSHATGPFIQIFDNPLPFVCICLQFSDNTPIKRMSALD